MRRTIRVPSWVGALLIVLVAGFGSAVTITIAPPDDDGQPAAEQPRQQVPTEVKVDGPDADGKADDTLTVDPQVAEQVEREVNGDGATPVDGGELDESLRQPNDSPATTIVPGPLASDEVPGCRTRFVGNSSSRGGARPSLIFLHQTVSRERGWSSQNALTAMAARRSSGVSWHLLVGRSGGRCTYTVPLALKAWTQANANPWAVGIEVEAFGDEGAYVTGAGRARLVSVVRHVARRYGIPLRRGAVSRSSCRPIRSGVVEHSDAGACGGGHVDVTLSPFDSASAIAAAARAGSASSGTTSVDRVTCRKIRWWRSAGRPHGKPEQNAVRRRKALERRGVTCTSRGPVKR